MRFCVRALVVVALLTPAMSFAAPSAAKTTPEPKAKSATKPIDNSKTDPSDAVVPTLNTGATGKLTISPQMVVDLALSKGREARAAELVTKRSYYEVSQARSVFDLQFKANAGYQKNRAETLNGLSNIEDRTTSLGVDFEKKFQTGTTATLNFDSIKQESLLNPNVVNNRQPRRASDVIGLTLRQPVFRNFFGLSDRLAVEIAESHVDTALENREEELEKVLLDAMTLFWNAYVAQQELKQNIFARDKYLQLVKNVRRKSGFNLSAPGELPRLEAETGVADQNVKRSSAAYLDAVDLLLTAVQMPPAGEYDFSIPAELPPVPKLSERAVDDLRTMRVAQLNLKNAQKELRLARSQGLPALDVIASAQSTGIDNDGSAAVAEMSAGSKPTYFIGVEFSTPLDSSLYRGAVADRQIAIDQAQNALDIQRDKARNELSALERRVVADFSVAKQAVEVVDFRYRVVRQLETSYRQGRLPLVELIRAFNDHSAAVLDKERAVGDYHISLNRLAASRDELVTEKR